MGGPTRIQPEHTPDGAVSPVTPKAGGVKSTIFNPSPSGKTHWFQHFGFVIAYLWNY